jgi:hypothetical protein
MLCIALSGDLVMHPCGEVQISAASVEILALKVHINYRKFRQANSSRFELLHCICTHGYIVGIAVHILYRK